MAKIAFRQPHFRIQSNPYNFPPKEKGQRLFLCRLMPYTTRIIGPWDDFLRRSLRMQSRPLPREGQWLPVVDPPFFPTAPVYPLRPGMGPIGDRGTCRRVIFLQKLSTLPPVHPGFDGIEPSVMGVQPRILNLMHLEMRFAQQILPIQLAFDFIQTHFKRCPSLFL